MYVRWSERRIKIEVEINSVEWLTFCICCGWCVLYIEVLFGNVAWQLVLMPGAKW